MKLFDFIFGKNTKLSELDANTKSDDNVYKKQDDKRQKIDTVEPFVFKSNVSSMNLEYGKLCIQCALYMDARLFREHAISGNCPKHVYYEILKTPVP